MKYAMLIYRWSRGYTNREDIEIKAESLDELCRIFNEMRNNNNLLKYEKLCFVKVYELK